MEFDQLCVYQVGCQKCLTQFELRGEDRDFDRWSQGELIQVALPYLSDDERELLISGICGECFDEMFGPQSGQGEDCDS